MKAGSQQATTTDEIRRLRDLASRGNVLPLVREGAWAQTSSAAGPSRPRATSTINWPWRGITVFGSDSWAGMCTTTPHPALTRRERE